MKYLLPAILLFYSCNTFPGKSTPVVEKYDTAFTKEKAEQELKKIRTSITDSGFAVIVDANLQIQKVEFILQKADTSRIKKGFADSLIVIHNNGQLLYTHMMKLYTLALRQATKSSDINHYKKELAVSQEDWLRSKFWAKKTYEALISVRLLQKDAALISMIVNNTDNEETRKLVEEQYSSLIENMEKSYSSSH